MSLNTKLTCLTIYSTEYIHMQISVYTSHILLYSYMFQGQYYWSWHPVQLRWHYIVVDQILIEEVLWSHWPNMDNLTCLSHDMISSLTWLAWSGHSAPSDTTILRDKWLTLQQDNEKLHLIRQGHLLHHEGASFMKSMCKTPVRYLGHLRTVLSLMVSLELANLFIPNGKSVRISKSL